MTVPIWLDLASLSLDELAALRDALRTKPGQRSPETRAAIERSDNLICEYARRFYPGLTRNQQAEHTARDLARYETTSWQHARADVECPHNDARRQLLWRILKERGRALRVRAITEILSRRP
ncbi:hypothetical protein [Bradyrhizobium sp. USDA 10063]